ncbi:MAG: hypothetical protein ACK6CU_00785 [Deltaproteobacteria bacterium]
MPQRACVLVLTMAGSCTRQRPALAGTSYAMDSDCAPIGATASLPDPMPHRQAAQPT